MQKNGLSEDIATDAEKEIQEMTNKFIALIEKHLAAKEKEIMSV
jgi:ribosome recycling factor